MRFCRSLNGDMLEGTRDGYLAGNYVLREYNADGGSTEYLIIKSPFEDDYQIHAWTAGQPEPKIIAEGLTADEAWNFLKLIGE